MVKTWIEPQPVEVPADLRAAVGGHALAAEMLARRGLTTPEAARAFLDPAYYHPASAGELPDMDRAVDRIRRAIRGRETIGVWGDFDVDGQTATALLVSALREPGANVIYHIPNRQREGHGIGLPKLKDILDSGVEVILTCDTGIAAQEAVEYAQSRGVDVVITDHHNLPPTLPDAYAVVNPKRLPESHPLHELPGVGCAYKLVEALYAGRSADHLLDLVALGIVADVAVQTGDTRYLLQRGLDVLRSTPRLGLRAIMEQAELNQSELSEQHIGFVLGPRLNALGRLADANPAVELLTSGDLEQARILANQLEGLNAERKLLCAQVYGGAQAQIEKDETLLQYAALVLSHPQWHTGVVGIVANWLVEDYNRPVILLAANGGIARGSARSVYGCDITAAIAAHRDLLIGFGGHTMAAGLSLEAERIPDFRRALSRTVRAMLGKVDTTPTLPVDAFVNLSDLSLDLVQNLERLAPFGPGNPPVTLAARGLTLLRHSPIGRTGEHLQLVVADETGTQQRVVWWQGADQPLPPGRFDLAFVVRASSYKGQREVLVEWVEARPLDDDLLDLDRGASLIEVIDQRGVESPLASLRRLRAEQDDLMVWREAESNPEVRGLNRNQLVPAKTLVVWTIPPGHSEWQTIIERVAPETVYLFGVDPGMDELDAFVKRLAGLVKYALTTKQGVVSLSELAAATAHRDSTVRAGLAWLAASGQIQVVEQTNGEFQLSIGDKRSQPDLPQLTDQLQRLLKETAAYRAYWLRKANPLT